MGNGASGTAWRLCLLPTYQLKNHYSQTRRPKQNSTVNRNTTRKTGSICTTACLVETVERLNYWTTCRTQVRTVMCFYLVNQGLRKGRGARPTSQRRKSRTWTKKPQKQYINYNACNVYLESLGIHLLHVYLLRFAGQSSTNTISEISASNRLLLPYMFWSSHQRWSSNFVA